VGGLGIYMMTKKMMDEVKYNFDAANGNRLEMRKKTGG
jgi:anti-sigma regulatory factor (Ser/Thr protein kinase)